MIVWLSQAAVEQMAFSALASHPVLVVPFPCAQTPYNNQSKNNDIWLAYFSSVVVCNAGGKPQQIYPAKPLFTES